MDLNTKINFCKNDLNDNLFNIYQKSSYLAVDTEAMGLVHGRDRLCVIQISNEDNITAYIKLEINNTNSDRVKLLFENDQIKKIFHFARFDVAALKCNLQINTRNIFCTKIASKLARTYTNKHGLKDLVHELVKVELDKGCQSSDWGSENDFSKEQIEYATNDVRYLIEAMEKLVVILKREKRYELAEQCFSVIPIYSELDIRKFSNIFEH
tara:strand:+ start:1818 stop:2450 length:633 start_codon:yes stop_codon:yes gene_type:complete